MTDLNSLLQRFVQEHIALPQTDRQEAIRSREWVVERIRNTIRDTDDGPRLFGEMPVLYYGSYFRGTKVSAADEFDIMFVIDSNGGQFSQRGTIVGTGLGTADPNRKYDGRFHKEDQSGISPMKLLNWLSSVVQESLEEFGVETPIRDGQAITLHLHSRNIHLDLIPAGAFESTDGSGRRFYDIPRGDRANGWILTNPVEDRERIEDVADGRENFRSVIRIVKYLKQPDHYNMAIPSFAVEHACIMYAEETYWTQSIWPDLYGFFGFLCELLKDDYIPDPQDEESTLFNADAPNAQYADRIDRITREIESIEHIQSTENAYNKLQDLLANET